MPFLCFHLQQNSSRIFYSLSLDNSTLIFSYTYSLGLHSPPPTTPQMLLLSKSSAACSLPIQISSLSPLFPWFFHSLNTFFTWFSVYYMLCFSSNLPGISYILDIDIGIDMSLSLQICLLLYILCLYMYISLCVCLSITSRVTTV